jgi:hypothetical protein
MDTAKLACLPARSLTPERQKPAFVQNANKYTHYLTFFLLESQINKFKLACRRCLPICEKGSCCCDKQKAHTKYFV